MLTDTHPSDRDVEEAALLAGIRRGDREAVTQVLQTHNRTLWRLARSILRDDAEAEDVVQETYARAFASIDGFRGQARLGTWLARIALNEALGRLGRRRSALDVSDFAETLADDHPGSLVTAPPRPEHFAAQQEIRRMVEQAVDALPLPFRAAFVLRVVEQKSIEETADTLGIPAATVKTRLHRANEQLRLRLGADLAAVFDDAFPFGGMRCQRLTGTVLARVTGPPTN